MVRSESADTYAPQDQRWDCHHPGVAPILAIVQLRFAILCVVLSGSLGPFPALAQTQVSVLVQGTIDFVRQDSADQFSIGDAFTIEYSFDSNAPDLDETPEFGRYESLSSIVVTVGDHWGVWPWDEPPQHPRPAYIFVDSTHLRYIVDVPRIMIGETLFHAALTVQGPVSSDELPAIPLDLSEWSGSLFLFDSSFVVTAVLERFEIDTCPYISSSNNQDGDGNGIGDLCECGDQNADGRVDVSDLVAINIALFNPTQVSPLCDTNYDNKCNVSDIIGANYKIFGRPAYCSRYPPPGP